MKPVELKIARIGNSRGVRLPAATLERFGIGDRVIMEERSDGILLRARGASPERLSWAETAKAIVASSEDWSDWDSALADGLDGIVWDEPKQKRVAEPHSKYSPRKSAKKSTRKKGS
ncbi:MAG: AbrB/MazE/SpoVT family DNA-binding domain-containing protein [Gemmatimonadaceae bacterium]